jgi:hypothetical protein
MFHGIVISSRELGKIVESITKQSFQICPGDCGLKKIDYVLFKESLIQTVMPIIGVIGNFVIAIEP